MAHRVCVAQIDGPHGLRGEVKVKSFTAVGGCQRQNSNVICSTSASSKVYSNTYSSTPSAVTLECPLNVWLGGTTVIPLKSNRPKKRRM